MKPVILTVDDDPQVLRSVERDLRSKYGNEFRVLRADSGLTALEILKQLKLRNESLALLVVDQRMPNMTGVEFLEQAMNIFPDAKRVLLMAYADTDAAIRSINNAKIVDNKIIIIATITTATRIGMDVVKNCWLDSIQLQLK